MSRFDFAAIRERLRGGGTDIAGLVTEIYAAIARRGADHVWIHLPPITETLARAKSLDPAGPLYGLPFAVKDNIDVAGMPTTAACPDFAYMPRRSATVVERLEAAGALVIGKTNLDQFATGLVGVRSPYGACASVFDPEYISGGSSSGSAVAVAAGLVAFSLGTDTAGSGRVPAAFNGIVGLKPSRGLLSARGVVPACRSLDCVSIFAHEAADALEAAAIAAGFDAEDCYSRAASPGIWRGALPPRFRFGLPREDQWEFFGDEESRKLYAAAIRRMKDIGGEAVEIDYAPFLETARLLYEGPWVAERLAVLEDFATAHPDSLHPVTRNIVLGAAGKSAVDTFRGLYRLEELRRRAADIWSGIDTLLLPTAPTIYKIAEVEADPIRLNSRLGHYTNFVNLLDLAAIAVPAGHRPDGLPFGVTLMGPAFADGKLGALGAAFMGREFPTPVADGAAEGVPIAVVGAHLSGMPLNRELVELGGRFLKETRTAPFYKLFALPGSPARPGLIRTGEGGGGAAIALEIWDLPPEAAGRFLSRVKPPLALGNLLLEDGGTVTGFLCESYALDGAPEITRFGGWRAYREGQA